MKLILIMLFIPIASCENYPQEKPLIDHKPIIKYTIEPCRAACVA